jgi:hypothetical protein
VPSQSLENLGEKLQKDKETEVEPNLVERLMKGISMAEIVGKESGQSPFEKEMLPLSTKVTVLKYLKDHFSSFLTSYENENRQTKDSDNVMSLFRYPFATYLTTNCFKSLGNELAFIGESLSKSQKISELELHCLLYTLQLT